MPSVKKIAIIDDFYSADFSVKTEKWKKYWGIDIEFEKKTITELANLFSMTSDFKRIDPANPDSNKNSTSLSVDGILWSAGLVDLPLEQMQILPKQFSQNILHSQAFDFWYFDRQSAGPKWWPKSRFQKGISILCTQNHGHLNVHKKVYLVGNHPLAWIGLVGLLEMGFSDINILGVSEDICQKYFHHLQKSFFSVRFKSLKDNEITHMPSDGSLILNALPNTENGPLKTNLTFFNYLQSESLVLDLFSNLADSELLTEAKEVGHSIVQKSEVEMVLDYELLRIGCADKFKSVTFSEFRNKMML